MAVDAWFGAAPLDLLTAHAVRECDGRGLVADCHYRIGRIREARGDARQAESAYRRGIDPAKLGRYPIDWRGVRKLVRAPIERADRAAQVHEPAALGVEGFSGGCEGADRGKHLPVCREGLRVGLWVSAAEVETRDLRGQPVVVQRREEDRLGCAAVGLERLPESLRSSVRESRHQHRLACGGDPGHRPLGRVQVGIDPHPRSDLDSHPEGLRDLLKAYLQGNRDLETP